MYHYRMFLIGLSLHHACSLNVADFAGKYGGQVWPSDDGQPQGS